LQQAPSFKNQRGEKEKSDKYPKVVDFFPPESGVDVHLPLLACVKTPDDPHGSRLEFSKRDLIWWFVSFSVSHHFMLGVGSIVVNAYRIVEGRARYLTSAPPSILHHPLLLPLPLMLPPSRNFPARQSWRDMTAGFRTIGRIFAVARFPGTVLRPGGAAVANPANRTGFGLIIIGLQAPLSSSYYY
jgi:hypothetical protein